MIYKLSVSPKELQTIIDHLYMGKYSEVVGVIESIKEQYNEQIKVEEPFVPLNEWKLLDN